MKLQRSGRPIRLVLPALSAALAVEAMHRRIPGFLSIEHSAITNQIHLPEAADMPTNTGCCESETPGFRSVVFR